MNSPNRTRSLLEPPEETLTSQLSLERSIKKKILYFTSFYQIAVMTTCSIIIARQTNDGYCQSILTMWIVVNCFIWLINQCLQILSFKYSERDNNNYLLERLNKAYKVVNPLSLAVTVCGHVLLFYNQSCLYQTPTLFYLSVFMLAHAYILLSLTIVFFLLAILCYPCLLRLARPMLDTQKGLSQEEIQKLDLAIYQNIKAERDEPHETCVICLETFKNTDKVILLECQHLYHQNCVTEWLLINNNCPICRKNTKNDTEVV